MTPLHEALGWHRDMPAALGALIRWGHDLSGKARPSALEKTWLSLVAPGTSCLAAIEALLGGGEEEDRAMDATILFLDVDELTSVIHVPGIPTARRPVLEVGALTLATIQRDMPSLRRLLRRERVHGQDAKTALYVDQLIGTLGDRAVGHAGAGSFRKELVEALWFKRYTRPKLRFLGLVPELMRVGDVEWLRILARSVKKPDESRARRWMNPTDGHSPLTCLLTHRAPLSLVAYFVGAGASVQPAPGAPEAMAPVLLAAGLRLRTLVVLAAALESVHDGAAQGESPGNETAGRLAGARALSLQDCELLRSVADCLHFRRKTVKFLLDQGASPWAEHTTSHQRDAFLAHNRRIASDPKLNVEQRAHRYLSPLPAACTVTLLDVATMAGEEDIAEAILDHAEYQVSAKQALQTRRIAASLVAARARPDDPRVAAVERISSKLQSID